MHTFFCQFRVLQNIFFKTYNVMMSALSLCIEKLRFLQSPAGFHRVKAAKLVSPLGVWRLLPKNLCSEMRGGEGPRGEHTPTACVRVFQNRDQHLVTLHWSYHFVAEVHPPTLGPQEDISGILRDARKTTGSAFLQRASWPRVVFTHGEILLPRGQCLGLS